MLTDPPQRVVSVTCRGITHSTLTLVWSEPLKSYDEELFEGYLVGGEFCPLPSRAESMLLSRRLSAHGRDGRKAGIFLKRTSPPPLSRISRPLLRVIRTAPCVSQVEWRPMQPRPVCPAHSRHVAERVKPPRKERKKRGRLAWDGAARRPCTAGETCHVSDTLSPNGMTAMQDR